MLESPALTAVTDESGAVLSIERAAGGCAEGWVDRPLADGLSPASRTVAAKALRAALATGRPVACRLRMLDGGPYDCELARLPAIGGRRLVSFKAWRSADEPRTAEAKYVAVDVVGYSRGRSVEAQADIIAALNAVVGSAVARLGVEEESVVYIPTGDGLYVALLDLPRPYDVHVRLALAVLESLAGYNAGQVDARRRFELRVAVNEGVDTLVTDINGRRNIAGDGVTLAARILDAADGGTVLLGERVHQRLRAHEAYCESFRSFDLTVKHGLELKVYQLVGTGLPYVNEEIPCALANPASHAGYEPESTRCIEMCRELCQRMVVN